MLLAGLALCCCGRAYAFDSTPPLPFSASSCAPMQRKFFVIRLESKLATRTLTFNKGAGIVVFRGSAEKDLKWTMPLSDFRFSAPVVDAARSARTLSALYRDGGTFEFGTIDEACWNRLRRYGAGALSFE
jgi:hypothetical protein